MTTWIHTFRVDGGDGHGDMGGAMWDTRED